MTSSCETFTITGSTHAITLTKPSWNGENNSTNRLLDSFNFWSDNYAIHDGGVESKPLILTGIEIATTTDTLFDVFKFLNETMDLHEQIKIDDLNDCINAIYIIKDLSVDTIPRYGKYALSWRMTLEKVRDLTIND